MKLLAFFIVAIGGAFALVLSPWFKDLNTLYITSNLCQWLASIAGESIAKSAFNRFTMFAWIIITFIWWGKYVEKTPLFTNLLTTPKNHRFRYFGIGFLVQATLLATTFIFTLLQHKATFEGFNHDILNAFSYILIAGTIISFNVLAEELVFRGYLVQKFGNITTPLVACFLSTVLFMIAHPFHSLGWYGVIIQPGLLGLGFALVAFYTNSIYATWGMHLAGNLLTRGIATQKLVIFCNPHPLSFETMYALVNLTALLVFVIIKRKSFLSTRRTR